MPPSLYSHDLLVLLKAALWNRHDWKLDVLAEETGHTPSEAAETILRAQRAGLMTEKKEVSLDALSEFLIFSIQYVFPARPGEFIRGMCTGPKPGLFLGPGLPYMYPWVWPNNDWNDIGSAIEPLSPHCCFAALNDPKLRLLLSITDTLRVLGKTARPWAQDQLNKILHQE